MKKHNKVLLIPAGILVLGGFLVGYILFIRPLFLPVYQMGQVDMGDQFFATTLTINSQTYISGKSEVGLELSRPWLSKTRMIGRTDGGLEIYSIPNVHSDQFIVLSGLMFPSMILRNSSIEPIFVNTLQVDKIEIYRSLDKSLLISKSKDQHLINEVKSTLRDETPTQITREDQSPQTFFMRLSSVNQPGIDYFILVYVDETHSVYLAERTSPEHWLPAGSELSQMVLTALKN